MKKDTLNDKIEGSILNVASDALQTNDPSSVKGIMSRTLNQELGRIHKTVYSEPDMSEYLDYSQDKPSPDNTNDGPDL